MPSFTTFAFDGLRSTKKSKGRKSRGKSLGRTPAGRARGTERRCGCKLTTAPRRGRGRQPVIMCPGTPMWKYVSKRDVGQYRGEFCADMLKPFQGRRRKGR